MDLFQALSDKNYFLKFAESFRKRQFTIETFQSKIFLNCVIYLSAVCVSACISVAAIILKTGRQTERESHKIGTDDGFHQVIPMMAIIKF